MDTDRGDFYKGGKVIEVNRFIFEDLVIWLESHEEDIADGINDFGSLRHIFLALVGHEPRSEERLENEDK